MGEGSKNDGINASKQEQSLRPTLLVYSLLLGRLHLHFLPRLPSSIQP